MNSNSDPYLSSHRTRSNVPRAQVAPTQQPAQPAPSQLIRRRSAHLPLS